MGGEKSVYEVLKWLKNSPFSELYSNSDQFSKPSADKSFNATEEDQVFSDHILGAKRFQKTLYYGEISHSAFHSSLALTDVTLELFNKTVPNEGRLDILDMDYASHITKSVSISPYSMILAMMYVEQLRHKNPDYLENVSPCDLYVVSMLVASKYLFDDDDCTYNYDWTNVTNLEITDLNRLEKEFLSAVNWELFVKPSEFSDFLALIEEKIALKWSSERGWLSYTDMYVLARKNNFKQFWFYFSKFVIKVMMVVTVGYISSVIALYGTMFFVKFIVTEIANVSCKSSQFNISEIIPSLKESTNSFDALNVYLCQQQNSMALFEDYTNFKSSKTFSLALNENTKPLICSQKFESVNEASSLSYNLIYKLHEEQNKVEDNSKSVPVTRMKLFSKETNFCRDLKCDDSVVLWPLYSFFSNHSF